MMLPLPLFLTFSPLYLILFTYYNVMESFLEISFEVIHV